jgi:hypothetical protein
MALTISAGSIVVRSRLGWDSQVLEDEEKRAAEELEGEGCKFLSHCKKVNKYSKVTRLVCL